MVTKVTGKTEVLTVSGGDAVGSNIFGDSRNHLRIRVSTNIGVHFRISDDSSLATTNDPYLPANSVETFALSAGDHFSVIRPAASTATGICTVTIVA